MKKKNKVRQCMLALLLAATLVIETLATPQSEYLDNYKKRSALQIKIDSLSEEIGRLSEENAVYQLEVDAIQYELDGFQQELDDIDEKIEEMQESIDYANMELDDKYAVYCARIREYEEYGKMSYWSIIFQASSVTDMLNRIDYVEELISYDETALSLLEEKVSELQEQAEELAELRADENYLRVQLRTSQMQLQEKINQRIKEISELTEQQEENEIELAALFERSEELSSIINGDDYNGSQDAEHIYQRFVVESGELHKTPKGAAIVKDTLQFLGGEYVWGGASPSSGFDCSGLMYYIYGQHGYTLNRTARPQYKYDGRKVAFENLQAGDMVFFHPPGEKEISHVGMYIGGGMFVHAANRTKGIIVSSLYSNYYTENFYGAKRVIV